jgi:gamma-polyglutamate synthase
VTLFTVFACLVYLAWLVREDRLARKHRRALRHVIHVNGIRGKSSVCRLIDAALRADGFRVLTKTTGTCPAVIHVDGSEERLRRMGKPSIKEQLRILRLAALNKADVLVIECMAVMPEYQKTSEERMLRSDIGVITNVRLDHLDEMGETLDEIAEALSHTVPEGGTLFTAEEAYGNFFRGKARERGTSFVLSEASGIDYREIDFTDNVSLALAVCEHLGVNRETALTGMRNYRKDPGAFSIERTIGVRGKQLVFLNALAANDPSSAERILDLVEAQGFMASGERILLVNNRYDRPARMKQFIDFAVKHERRFDRIVAAGNSRAQMRRTLVKRGISPGRIVRVGSLSELAALERDAVVFAVGNIVGSGRVRSEADRRAGIFDVR